MSENPTLDSIPSELFVGRFLKLFASIRVIRGPGLLRADASHRCSIRIPDAARWRAIAAGVDRTAEGSLRVRCHRAARRRSRDSDSKTRRDTDSIAAVRRTGSRRTIAGDPATDRSSARQPGRSFAREQPRNGSDFGFGRSGTCDPLHRPSARYCEALGCMRSAISTATQSSSPSHRRRVPSMSHRASKRHERASFTPASMSSCFGRRERDPELRRQLGIPSIAPVVLTVGQIGLRKGWDVLADAAVRLADQWPNLHVVLVGERFGSKSETVEYEATSSQMLSNAMPGRAHFLGTRDDVPELMTAADVLVHPARQEPFGRVLLEAAATGLAIVATDVGGTREILEDGVSARLVPAGNAAELAQAIDALLKNPDERRRLGSAARERVERRFSADVAAEALATEWERVL